MRVEYVSGNIVAIYNNKLTLTDDVKSIYIYKNTPGTALTRDLDITNIQIEIGTAPTNYEPYEEPIVYQTIDDTGRIYDIKSRAGTMTFLTDGTALAFVQYNRDINKAFQELRDAIISLGGNV